LRRREFVTFLAAAALFSGEGRAQQGKVRRIGFLGTGAASAIAGPLEAFRASLRKLGYAEGTNLSIEYRYGEDDRAKLGQYAAELVALKPELIAVWGTAAALALKKSTSTLPIVLINVGDPVDTGLIASLARPGGNITGMSNLGGAVSAKQLEMLAKILPGVVRVAVLRNPDNPSLVPQLKGAESAARSLGMKLSVHDVRTRAEFEAAFASMAAERASAVLVLAEPLFFSERKRLAELANRHRLPTVTARAEVAEAGLLLAYGANTVAQYQEGAVYVDKILRGARPADLPVQQATRFDLVVNMQTARALGIKVPSEILGRADRIIE
jgi:putative ABC transport system substrate-binding protein